MASRGTWVLLILLGLFLSYSVFESVKGLSRKSEYAFRVRSKPPEWYRCSHCPEIRFDDEFGQVFQFHKFGPWIFQERVETGLSDFTLSAWIKPTRDRRAMMLFSTSGGMDLELRDLSSKGFLVNLKIYSDVLQPQRHHYVSTFRVVPGRWSHIQITRSSGVIKFYLDGKEDPQQSVYDKMIPLFYAFYVGRPATREGLSPNAYVGDIADLAIANRVKKFDREIEP